MKKSLIALCLAALSTNNPEWLIAPERIGRLKQHPSLRSGKSGVAAARRAKRRRKAKR
jgi:hypothetical protein